MTLTIMYNWVSWSLLEISHKNSDNFFTDVAIGYENPNNSRLAVFVKTGSIGTNGVFIKVKYVGNTEANFVYDIQAKNPSDYTNYSTKILHNASGVYFNEAQL